MLRGGGQNERGGGNRLMPNSHNSRVLLSTELRNMGMKLDHLKAVIKENHQCEGIEHCIVSMVYSFQMFRYLVCLSLSAF